VRASFLQQAFYTMRKLTFIIITTIASIAAGAVADHIYEAINITIAIKMAQCDRQTNELVVQNQLDAATQQAARCNKIARGITGITELK
jgi:hypothetical protein